MMGVVPQPDYETNLPYQLYKYYFNINTPGLAEGVPILQPAPDSVILDAFIVAHTAWNETAEADLVFEANEDLSQTLAYVGTPTAGTFIAEYEGASTAALPYNESIGNLQTALNGLSTIGASGVTVTGSPGAWVVTFDAAIGNNNPSELIVNSAGLTGGTISVTPAAAGIFAKLGSGAVSLTSASAQYGPALKSLSDYSATKLALLDPPPNYTALQLVVNQTGIPGGAASTATTGSGVAYIAVAQPISINPTDVPLPLN
jgi:hypothetical protein